MILQQVHVASDLQCTQKDSVITVTKGRAVLEGPINGNLEETVGCRILAESSQISSMNTVS